MRRGDLVRVKVQRLERYEEYEKPMVNFRNNCIGEIVSSSDISHTVRFSTIYIENGRPRNDEDYVEFFSDDLVELSELEIQKYRFKSQNKPVNR